MRFPVRTAVLAVLTIGVVSLLPGRSVLQGQRAAAAQSASSAVPATASPGAQRALIATYCVTCHNEKTRAGQLVLEGADVEHIGAGAEVWEKVVRKLRAGAMPPSGAPRPEAGRLDDLATWLEREIDREAALTPNPGRTVPHRLNRTEYANAVRDLLGLDVNAKALLPTDNSGFGFDNIGDVLSLSPALLERYLIAAQSISRLAVGDAAAPTVATYRIPFSMRQEDRMQEELPFGSRGGSAFRFYFPADGEYSFRIRMQRSAMSNGVRGDARLNQIDVRIDGKRVQTFSAGGIVQSAGFFDTPKEVDAGMDIRVPVKAGEHRVAVTFQRAAWEMEGVGPSHLPTASYGYANATNTHVTNGRIDMGVDMVEIAGPFGAAGRSQSPNAHVFVCRPTQASDESVCARKIISTLARRAYRRPVTETDVTTLVEFFEAEQRVGGFDAGIRRVIERVLLSPHFLFRFEPDPANVPAGRSYPVSDVELASRLSFFLWSSIPDDELLDVASRGRLRSPGVLAQQVRRMLLDARSTALVDNFFGQWLFLRNIDLVRPDPKAYPEFDEDLRAAFRQETELFLESQLRDDRSALDLLTANYTFVNERLAGFYGIPDVHGERFRRVVYPDDRRAGILGQGAILTTINAYANRTSPVKRGQWLLENLLGTPPPPPPPNVPAFPENDGNNQPKSVRERMELHRRNPVCATCHKNMDPLGFALENFNAVGRWRTSDGGTAIDASGVLPNGRAFDGPADFRKALLENRSAILQTLTQKMLTYGVGRGAEYYDMPSIRRILRDASPADYRWSSLILGVVSSDAFQMRVVQR